MVQEGQRFLVEGIQPFGHGHLGLTFVMADCVEDT